MEKISFEREICHGISGLHNSIRILVKRFFLLLKRQTKLCVKIDFFKYDLFYCIDFEIIE